MKKIVDNILKFFFGAGEHRIANNAAACAFSLFVSVLPFLIIIISLIPYTPITEAWLVSISNKMLPADVSEYVFGIIDELYTNSVGAISLSAVVLLWSSSRTIVYIRDGLNDIYGYNEKKNFLVVRTLATVFMAIVVLCVVGLSFIGVVANYVQSFITTFGLTMPSWLSTIIDYQVLIVLMGLFFVNLIIYCLFPARKNKVSDELPGAILTTVVCYLLLIFFNLLLKKFISFSMYGSLAAIIIILFYFNSCCYIMLLGAYFNYFIRKENIVISENAKVYILAALIILLSIVVGLSKKW